MGSFLNCAALRYAKGESFVRGRSHCVSCGHPLSARDLIPLFSWLFLRGRCRYCGVKISARYLWAEITGCIVFVSVVLRFGVSPETAEYLILASLTLALAFTDLACRLLPDGLILAGLAVRIVFILCSENVPGEALQSVIGAFSVSLPVFLLVLLMEKVWKKEAMGGGDIKLLFMLGSYLSWQENLLGLILACVFGLLFAAIGKKDSGTDRQIPFGPAIALGSWASLLFGQALLAGYLSLFL